MGDLIIPKVLKDAVIDNNLIIFVGAGLSSKLINKDGQQLEGWYNLVCQLLSHLAKNGYDVELYEKKLKQSSKEPIDILKLIEEDQDLPRDEIVGFIKKFYSLKDWAENSLHKNIYKLSNKIITTNYDDAFEIAIPELKNHIASSGKEYELATLHKAKTPTLFKLHGCITNGGSMILLPSDYDNLYDSKDVNAERTLFYLRNLITNKHILFIGCGMGDFQINKIFEGVRQQLGKFNELKHFTFTKNQLDSKLNFLTPIMLSDFSEIDDYIVELVKIKEDSQNTEESVRLKKELEKVNKEKVENAKKAQNAEQKLDLLAAEFSSEALELHIKKDYREAIGRYKDVIKINPDDDEAFHNMGVAYGELGDHTRAMECYKKSLEINPDDDEALNNMGVVYSKSGNYTRAMECYKKSLEINPDDAVFYNMGVAYGELGDYSQSIECFKSALGINPVNDSAFYNMGVTYDKLGDYTQAIDCYKKSLEIKPDKYGAFYNMGSAYDELGDYTQAIDCYKKSLEIKPNNDDALNNMGLDYFKLGDIPNAEVYTQKAIDLGNFDYGKMNMGHIHLAKKDEKKALACYKSALINFSSKEEFFEEMKSDFQYLIQYGITQEQYSQVLKILRGL